MQSRLLDQSHSCRHFFMYPWMLINGRKFIEIVWKEESQKATYVLQGLIRRNDESYITWTFLGREIPKFQKSGGYKETNYSLRKHPPATANDMTMLWWMTINWICGCISQFWKWSYTRFEDANQAHNNVIAVTEEVGIHLEQVKNESGNSEFDPERRSHKNFFRRNLRSELNLRQIYK